MTYFGVGYYIYATLAKASPGCDPHCANKPNQFTDNEKESEFPFEKYYIDYWETHRFSGGDPGIELDAWWIPITKEGPGDAPVVICSHGVRSNKYDQDMLTVAGMLHLAGFNVLLFDQRDHGDSTVEDGQVSIGTKEYRDIIASVDWLIEKQDIAAEKIGVYGESMGAATAAIAFGLDKRIQSVILDNGYLDLKLLIREELKRNNYPAWLAHGAVWAAAIFAGESLLEPTPRLAFINHDNRPIFAMHGTADTRVAPHHTTAMKALGDKLGANLVTWFADDAIHSGIKYLYPDEFSQRVKDFFSKSLSGTLSKPKNGN